MIDTELRPQTIQHRHSKMSRRDMLKSLRDLRLKTSAKGRRPRFLSGQTIVMGWWDGFNLQKPLILDVYTVSYCSIHPALCALILWSSLALVETLRKLPVVAGFGRLQLQWNVGETHVDVLLRVSCRWTAFPAVAKQPLPFLLGKSMDNLWFIYD